MAVATLPGDLPDQIKIKQLEVEQLKAEVEEVRLQSQQLRLQLQALGADASLVPSRIKAGSGTLEHFELRSLFQWLVESVNLEHQVVFECGNGEGEVQVGGRHVLLHRMASWQLSGSLKLSVPLELQAEISGLLLQARNRGRIDEEVEKFSRTWELLSAEVVSATSAGGEPAIFLVHRTTGQAVVVAKWPAVEFRQDSFDPGRHFGRRPMPPLGRSVETRGRNQERVEVEYEGNWFTGTLQSVEGDVANVKCDVDPAGVVTVAPLTSVRPVRKRQENKAGQQARRRARSVG
eukprot:Skav218740  [mRNA]  locus=scaffold1346:923797:932486:+ [translate_table: standard]